VLDTDYPGRGDVKRLDLYAAAGDVKRLDQDAATCSTPIVQGAAT